MSSCVRGSGHTRDYRERGVGASQSLDLALLIHTEYASRFRRVQILADNAYRFSVNNGSLESVNPSWRLEVGLESERLNKSI